MPGLPPLMQPPAGNAYVAKATCQLMSVQTTTQVSLLFHVEAFARTEPPPTTPLALRQVCHVHPVLSRFHHQLVALLSAKTALPWQQTRAASPLLAARQCHDVIANISSANRAHARQQRTCQTLHATGKQHTNTMCAPGRIAYSSGHRHFITPLRHGTSCSLGGVVTAVCSSASNALLCPPRYITQPG